MADAIRRGVEKADKTQKDFALLTACHHSFSGGTSFSVGARLPKGDTSFSAEALVADGWSTFKLAKIYKKTVVVSHPE